MKSEGYTVYAIEQVDDSINLGFSEISIPHAKTAIVFGNEVEGVDETLLNNGSGNGLCDGCIEIPQFGTKHSLNVSCAAAIVIWELSKQMRNQHPGHYVVLM